MAAEETLDSSAQPEPRRRYTKKTRVYCEPFPAIPNDSRLRPDGAVFDFHGRLKESAYQEFREHFSRELPVERHPNPLLPGMAENEVLPNGLKMWDDSNTSSTRDGCGWIAIGVDKKEGENRLEEKWFNVRTWGSWRLAFLLARLQRRVWERLSLPFAPLSCDGDDHKVVCGGISMAPSALRKAASEMARALRARGDSLLSLDSLLQDSDDLPCLAEEAPQEAGAACPGKRQSQGDLDAPAGKRQRTSNDAPASETFAESEKMPAARDSHAHSSTAAGSSAPSSPPSNEGAAF